VNWDVAMEKAEKALNCSSVPSSLEIITLIKKVNPTRVCLSEAERERGYAIKGRLQTLLLEQYGEAFYLDPHPLKPNIVLIKHTTLPTIDACHTPLSALSRQALDSVSDNKPTQPVDPPARLPRKAKTEVTSGGDSPQDALQRAEMRLAEFDYAGAGELFCGIRASTPDDVEIIERAARALIEDIGAPDQAVEMLLAQQRELLRAPRLRVLLARAFHLAGAFPEARSILDTMPVGELDKEALAAYAEIARKDGNLSLALKLVRLAEQRTGFVEGLQCLKKEVETALLAEAEPLVLRADSALYSGEKAEAEDLARQALQLYPSHQRAREIVAVIDSENLVAEVTAMWERLGQAVEVQERLELLDALLRRDPAQQEKITELIRVEKTRQKKELAQTRLEHLRTVAGKAAWREAFDLVWSLQDQEDQHEVAREACEVSPYLSLLHENRSLRKLSQKNARQTWIDTVKAMADLQSGQAGAALEIFEMAKHYFEKYEVFKKAYDEALQAVQEKAREEIKALLNVAAHEDTSLTEAENCYSAIRKAMAHLPAEERDECCRSIEARIAELTPNREDEFIQSYKYVAMSGSHERAAVMKSYISDEAALEACDRDIAAQMRIERSPVNLEFSDSLQVDLLSDQPLLWIGSTDRHILLREADDAIIVVHLEKMTANRFVSANFKDLHIADFLPSQDTFLFLDLKDPVPRWRADLSDEKSAFTARIEVAVFCEHEDDCPTDVFLSSEKEDEYYVMIYDLREKNPGRVVRKKLWSRNPVSDSIKIGNAVKPVMKRLSWHPDKFVIGADEMMKVCARNLTSDYAVPMMSPKDVWAIDVSNRHFYYFDRAILKKTNFKFEHHETFMNSECCFFLQQHQKLGLCPATTTLMLGCGPRAGLYDFSCNRISNYFSWGRIIGTRPARSWYTYDYSLETRTLKLRDVTDVLGTLLEWEEAEVPLNGREEKNPEWELKLHKQIYFGFKAEDQPEQPADGEESQPS
jgi:hypothetical protein